MVNYEIVEVLNGATMIKRTDENGIESWIPTEESNSDYQAYLRWVENPNAPEFQTAWVEPQLTK